MGDEPVSHVYRWLGQHAPVQDSSTGSIIAFTAGLIIALFVFSQLPTKSDKDEAKQASTMSSDPGLLRKSSTHESYTTASGITYSRIRTFFHPHPQATNLSLDQCLPLLVFVQGLGGSIAQCAPLLTTLLNNASCLAIDLPGCGLSDFEQKDPKAYRIEELARLYAAAIMKYRDARKGQRVVLVGHSMGCSVSALLASSTSPLAGLVSEHLAGVVAICPKAAASESEYMQTRLLRYIPEWLFDIFRFLDRRGGLESKSVTRVAGGDADAETKKLQLRYNEQSRTPGFMRVALGWLPDKDGKGGFPGLDVWRGIKVPLFLIAGDSDGITPAWNVGVIAEALIHPTKAKNDKVEDDITAGLPAVAGDAQLAEAQTTISQPSDTSAVRSERQNTTDDNVIKEADHSTKHAMVLKTTIFPAPAAHALFYSTATIHVLSGLLQSFLAEHIDRRLALGWQLQHLSTSRKWDVKNLAKWQTVDPISEPIAGLFRAMKTMREVDPGHCPKAFVQLWGWDGGKVRIGVQSVVDISHESPVYDPRGLEVGGVEYHKFPTVSKLPPAAGEVEAFLSLVDRLRRELPGHATLAVHCHYGFNRTGFFIVCYLVERLGYSLQTALGEFAAKRPPGIKHAYFVDELYVRYAVKMERRGTIVVG